MAKLHELLAAEKTPTSAWNALLEDTIKKFKNPTHYFDGHSKALSMIEETDANKATEAQAREEKPVVTNVFDTLEYALEVFGKAEDLQYQKNLTNTKALATVMFRGKILLSEIPVDELLGLESRLVKIRQLFNDVPTLDSTKHWTKNETSSSKVWETVHPEVTTKTEKTVSGVVMAPATDKHPAQVQVVQKDQVVGKFSTTKRSGAATTDQKAEAIKTVDELVIEVKQARMRANETKVEGGTISQVLIGLLLEPFKS